MLVNRYAVDMKVDENNIHSKTLESYIKDNIALELKEIYLITLNLCTEIETYNIINSSVYYRELSPSNILIFEDNQVILVHPSNSKLDIITNMPNNFVDPSNLQKLSKINIQKKLHNIGMVMYFMATGRLPFTTLEPFIGSNLTSTLDADLKRIITKCFQIDINDRYISIEELSRDLSFMILKTCNNNKHSTEEDYKSNLSNLIEDKSKKKVRGSIVRRYTTKLSAIITSALSSLFADY